MGKQWQHAHHHHHQATWVLATTIETEVAAVEQIGVTIKAAGPEKIRAAINLIATHSASNIGGSMLFEALRLLEEAYEIVTRG
jgi:hypothetical protein